MDSRSFELSEDYLQIEFDHKNTLCEEQGREGAVDLVGRYYKAESLVNSALPRSSKMAGALWRLSSEHCKAAEVVLVYQQAHV